MNRKIGNKMERQARKGGPRFNRMVLEKTNFEFNSSEKKICDEMQSSVI